MTQRRMKGEGSIKTLPSGRIEIRFWVEDPVSGDRVRKTVTGDDLEQAQANRDEILNRSQSGRPLKDAAITAGDFYARWESDVLSASERKQATIDQYVTLLKIHAIGDDDDSRPHLIGNRPLKDITPNAVKVILKEAVNRRSGEPLAASSLRSLYAALRAFFDDAVDENLIAVNPAALVKRPRSPRAKHRALLPEHADMVLQQAKGDRLHVVVVLAVLCGLRRGEILGLRWDDIDFDRSRIKVRGNLTRTSAGLSIGTPKSESGFRELHMLEDVRDALRDMQALQRREALAMRPGRRYNVENLVVVSVDGHPLDPRTVSRWYSKVAEAAGLPDRGLHALRHTVATLWMGSLRLTEVDAANLLGHSGTDLIASTYADAVADNQRAAMEAAALAIRSAGARATG